MEHITPCSVFPYWGSYSYWCNIPTKGNTLRPLTKYSSVKNGLLNSSIIGFPNLAFSTLVIPILGENRNTTSIKDVRVDNTSPWQRIHYNKLNAFYAKCIFWEEVAKVELSTLYREPNKYLLDWNYGIHGWVSKYIQFSTSKTGKQPEGIGDFIGRHDRGDHLSILHHLVHFYQNFNNLIFVLLHWFFCYDATLF